MLYAILILLLLCLLGIIVGFAVYMADYIQERKEIKDFINEQREKKYENESK